MEHFGERLRQAESGVYYTPSQTMEFFSLFDKPRTHTHKHIKYLDLICALDLETTSFRTEEDVAVGAMYLWMFGINGAVMVGRRWEEFEKFFSDLATYYRLSLTRRILIYVHNNSFDFQFYRKHFQWHEIFARSEREPMYATSTDGFEFRCSYLLTNSSLETVGKNLIRFPVQKLKGDLDYRLLRHYATPLTAKELQYGINDVLVVMSLIYDRRAAEKNNIAKIPLTQTGYARRECRSECLYKDKHALKYVYLMRELQLTDVEYVLAKAAFQGGFTHASPFHVGEVGHNLASYDFTSSYPTVIVAEQYPMGRGVEIDPSTIHDRAELNKLCLDFCCLMQLEFNDLDSKTDQDYYLSSSRCKYESADIFNGRISASKNITVFITEVDWELIQECYTWSSFRIIRLWRYKKAYLPTPYIRTVLCLYQTKTELKGVAGKEEDYARAKELLNSLYGMMAMQIDKPEVYYSEDQEWSSQDIDLDTVLTKYNTDTRRFISYLWGCYVTAYARRNLWSGIMNLKQDYWYSDTDSVKVSNYKRHQDYFERYNAWIDKKLQKAIEYHGLPMEMIHPKTKYGVEKPLGVWDFEGEITRFKTVGAKRYLYTTTTNGEEVLHITCAGVAKAPAVEYLWYKYKTLNAIFDAFEDGLCFPGEYTLPTGEVKTATGKSTHLYNDLEFDADLTDYLGYTAPVHELSSINLSPADYNLGISGAFKAFLESYWKGYIVNRDYF